jgi:hypothetical protein
MRLVASRAAKVFPQIYGSLGARRANITSVRDTAANQVNKGGRPKEPRLHSEKLGGMRDTTRAAAP